MGKKRTLSIFSAIQELDTEDVKAENHRKRKVSELSDRAEAAQSQAKLNQSLMECRILLQRSLTTEQVSVDKSVCDDLLQSLVASRRLLLGTEETSDDDDNKQDEGEPAALQNEYEACRENWKTVLNQRHKELKLHSGLTVKTQFRTVDQSFWQQVESTLEYEQLRETDSAKGAFDDTKVYQQLLKDFVTGSAKGQSHSASVKVKSKTKRSERNQVDRRASKGRKIRYKEIPKLVNFTFPLSRQSTSSLNEDEWFRSLFGGTSRSASR